jgi:hypothetical protein
MIDSRVDGDALASGAGIFKQRRNSMWWWSTSPPIYVLIWTVITNPGPDENHSYPRSVATHSHEFVGLAACEAARDALIARAHESSQAIYKDYKDKQLSEDAKRQLNWLGNVEVDIDAECFRKDSPQPRR